MAEYPQFASPAVASTIKDIEKVGQQFNGELATERERLDKLAAGGMTPVIFDGTGDRQKIDAIVSNLSHGKLELLAHLQRVQLGVVRTGGGIQVDIRTVREMDALLKERLGEVYGLRIAQLLHGRAVNGTHKCLPSFLSLALLHCTKSGRV